MSELVERMAGVEAKHEALVHSTDERFASVHRRIDNETATRLWVREELKPVAESVSELAGKIGEVVTLQKHSDERLQEFHATQREAMKQRTENERRETDAKVAALEAGSWRNVARRWWFWLLAGLAFLPQMSNAVEAFHKLFP